MGELFDKWLGAPRCALCRAQANGVLCEGCNSALPFNQPACPQCARAQSHDAPCADCLQHPPAFDAAWALLRLESPARESVHALKYHAGFAQARWLGRVMAQTLAAQESARPQVIIPVPLHRARLMRRGYNQALELARPVAKALRIPLEATWATRIRATPDQIGLDRAARRRNLRDAFTVSPRVSGLHIVLLDDVMTTGATFEALALAAKAAGATRVDVWAAMRA